MKSKKQIRRIVSFAIIFTFLIGIFIIPVYAQIGRTELIGKVYEFEKDNHYEISATDEYTMSDEANTYGSFSLEGKISNTTEKNSVPSYEVSDGNLKLFYTYGDKFLNGDESTRHLIEDKSKKINGRTISSNIMKGAVILQTSTDRKNWTDVECQTNVFDNIPIQTNSFYSTTDVQLINGCFYKFIVVYETRIKIDPDKFLFITIDKYEYKKHAEVYEFYACSEESAGDSPDTNQTYSLGSKIRAEHFDGYAGEISIEKNDDHYGWDLGDFFVSGYTDKVSDSGKDIVFLKNVGDKVTLWFKLTQDINALNGNKNLSITADTAGYDQYFETPKMDFGRGVLIIKYTDYNNVSGDPTIYTNYLEANATVGANTKVQLFEEGDYEIALDYQVTNNKLIDSTGHYRIFFKFSVRNGNCMVYPFDTATMSELSNSSMTDNGFKLDLAKSRYLRINVKREIMTDSADGLVEDTRFNGPAKDGAEYTDDGIYTITASNIYTQQCTTKRIYVGTNSILKAFMTTGLTIPEINNIVAQGASISNDGTIELSDRTKMTKTDFQKSDSEKSENNLSKYIWIIVVSIVMLTVVAYVLVIVFKKKKKSNGNENATFDSEEGDKNI